MDLIGAYILLPIFEVELGKYALDVGLAMTHHCIRKGHHQTLGGRLHRDEFGTLAWLPPPFL